MFDFPNSPTANQIVTGPNGATWQWDGVKWRANAVWQGATVIASDTPPVNPPTGALWWDSRGGQLYVNYADPNSVEWVIANTGGIPDAPLDGNTYARSNQQWVAITGAVAAAPNNTGRNLLHNGQFNVAQRGAGGFAVQGYTLDRWYLWINLDTDNVSQNALVDSQRTQIGDEAATVALVNTFTGNAGAASYSFITQNIEGVRRLANKMVTVSFWAWCGSGALKLGVSLDQNFGTGGSPSATVAGNGQSVTLSTTAARYSLTFGLPSAAGKTLGTNNNDSTGLNLWFSSGATQATRAGNIGVQSGAIGLWGVQLEIGSVATPLAKRDLADDLALCQRFYQTGYFAYNVYYAPAGNTWQTVYLPVTMRASPSVAFQNTGYSNGSGLVGDNLNLSSFRIYWNMTTASAGYVISNYTLSADL